MHLFFLVVSGHIHWHYHPICAQIQRYLISHPKPVTRQNSTNKCIHFIKTIKEHQHFYSTIHDFRIINNKQYKQWGIWSRLNDLWSKMCFHRIPNPDIPYRYFLYKKYFYRYFFYSYFLYKKYFWNFKSFWTQQYLNQVSSYFVYQLFYRWWNPNSHTLQMYAAGHLFE